MMYEDVLSQAASVTDIELILHIKDYCKSEGVILICFMQSLLLDVHNFIHTLDMIENKTEQPI